MKEIFIQHAKYKTRARHTQNSNYIRTLLHEYPRISVRQRSDKQRVPSDENPANPTKKKKK